MSLNNDDGEILGFQMGHHDPETGEWKRDLFWERAGAESGDPEAKGKLEDVTEEQTREAVRATFDKLAPNGSWIFSGMVYTLDFMDPTVQKINGWIMDEANRLSVEVYKH